MAQFAHGGDLTPAKISARIEYESRKQSPFEGMIEDRSRTRAMYMDNAFPQFSGNAPINNLITEFTGDSVDTVYVPQLRRLKSFPRLGDDIAQGHEEEPAVWERPIYINQIRIPVKIKQGNMDEARTPASILRAIQAYEPLIRDAYSLFCAVYGITYAILEHDSYHITRGEYLDWSGADGLNKGRRHLPIFVTANGGRVTHSVTHNTYDNSISTALATLDEGGANPGGGYIPSADALDRFKSILDENEVGYQIMEGGQRFRNLIVDERAMIHLRRDSRIREEQLAFFTGSGNKSPLIFNGPLYYNGFKITASDYVGLEAHYNCYYHGASTNGWKTQFGPMSASDGSVDGTHLDTMANILSSISSSTLTGTGNRYLKMALCLAPNALSMGTKKRLSFNEQEWDYAAVKGVAAKAIWGVSRNDEQDLITSPTEINSKVCAGLAWSVPPIS